MTWVRVWHTTAAEIETVEYIERPECSFKASSFADPCPRQPFFALTWSVNESGLPGLGSKRTDVVCDEHLAPRLRLIPFQYAGSVTITPYREVG